MTGSPSRYMAQDTTWITSHKPVGNWGEKMAWQDYWINHVVRLIMHICDLAWENRAYVHKILPFTLFQLSRLLCKLYDFSLSTLYTKFWWEKTLANLAKQTSFNQPISRFAKVANVSYCKFANIFFAKTLKWSIHRSFIPPEFHAIRYLLFSSEIKCSGLHSVQGRSWLWRYFWFGNVDARPTMLPYQST